MANNNSAAPAAKPPIQTAGMKASSGLANSGGKLKAYMDARGAKPPETTGGSYAGNMSKSRRMKNVPQAAQAAGRRRGAPVASTAARFSNNGTVPTGGRSAPMPPTGIGQLGARFGNSNPGGVQSTQDRVNGFLKQKQEMGGPQGGPQGGPTPNTKDLPPRTWNGTHYPPRGPMPPQRGGATPAATAKPAVKGGGSGMTQLGASTGVNTGAAQPGPLSAARGAMPRVKPQPSPPQRGGPQTVPAPPQTSRRTAVTGGGTGGGGGGGSIGPGRQRPMNV